MASEIFKIKTAWGYVVEYIARDATALARGNGYDSTSEVHALTRNAFAHSHKSAELQYVHGASIAATSGDFKELLPGGSNANDEYKDQYNNEVGRRIGQYVKDNNLSESAIDHLIVNAKNNGHLIVDPDESRVTNQTPPAWTAPTTGWEDDADPRDYTGLPDLGDLVNAALPYFTSELLGVMSPGMGMIAPRLQAANGLYGVAPNLATPLVLDLDGDGIETTKLGFGPDASPVYFDLDGDTFAERTAWVGGGDGLLAWDKNSNGTIDNNGELFGKTATYADGFANLAPLDTNSDDKITSADTNWSNLRVWVDSDGDGITDSGELKTFATLGITEISVDATPLTNTYNNENLVSATATFVMGGLTRTISDVWFRTDEMDSHNLTPVEIVEAALYLPTLKGFGLLKDLPLAASEDEDLLDLIATFATTWSTERFGDEAALDSDIREILFLWAGVDGINPASRGSYADAQELEFLERFFARPFLTANNMSNPANVAQQEALEGAFDYLFNVLKASLVVQLFGPGLFEEIPIYNPINGSITAGNLSIDALEDIGVEADAATDPEAYWLALARILLEIKDPEHLTSGEVSALNDAIHVSLPSSSWAAIVGAVTVDYGNSIIASTSSDYIVGLHAGNSINGQDGDDLIYGGRGNDGISGAAGNDILVGEAGQDSLSGGDGDDTYIFSKGFIGGSGGSDYIYDSIGGGTDTIKFVGVDPDDVRVWHSYATMYFMIDGSPNDLIAINDTVGSTGNQISDLIERVEFDDNTVWDLSSGLVMTDTDDGHQLFGSALDDTLDGRGGNDSLGGYDGNDILIGGAGQDSLAGNDGDDTYVFSPGFVGGAGGTDYLYESADEGIDTIKFVGVTPDQVRSWHGYYTMYFSIDGFPDDVIAINDAIDSSGAQISARFERIEFDDSTVWDLSSGLIMTDTDDAHQLFGSALNDTLDGRGGNDSLEGYAGEDILIGGAGIDGLAGGSGADIFVFQATSAFNDVDQIYDFDLTENDKLELFDLLNLYNPSTDDITDFVEITTSGSDSVLKIDADGGGDNFVQIATLYGVTGLTDEEALVLSGTLIVQEPTFAGLFASHYAIASNVSSLSQIDWTATPAHTEVVASINQPSTTSTPFYTGGPTDNFAVSYEGYLNVVTAGTYTFDLTSDDGSALWLDGELLIGNDGLHGEETQSASISLTAGSHTLETHYFEAGEDQIVRLSWSGADTGNVMEVIDGNALQNDGERVNIKPVTADDIETTDENTAVNIDVLANDEDADGDEIEVTAVTQGSHGAVVINVNGTLGYTPTTSYTGQDSFTYTVSDGHGGTSIAQVDVSVGTGAAGLFASHYFFSGYRSDLTQIDFSATPDHTETVASIDRTANDSTPFYTGGPTDNFAVSYEGYLNVVTAGNYTFDLTSDDGSALWLDGDLLIGNDGLHGTETESDTIYLTAGSHEIEAHYFELSGDQIMQLEWSGADTGNVMEVIDGSALTNLGEGVNIKIVAGSDIGATAVNTAVNIDVLANDSDADGDELDVTAITQGSHGAVVINVNGTLGYTPSTSYTGQDSFTYTVSDGNGSTRIVNVDVTIGSGAVYGTSGNDTINGSAGDDTIYGLGGNDTITGNAGQDDLYGGQGNDTYVFAAGFGAATTLGPDVVYEEASEGTDAINLSTVAFDDVNMWVDANDDLHIRSTSDNDDEIVVAGSALSGGGTDVTGRVESIIFSNGTNYISGSLFLQDSDDGHTIHGSAGGDLINANDGNDVIHGFGGNDILQGAGGTDTAYGGTGNDRYTGLGDGDVFYGEDGADWIEFLASNPSVSGGDTFADFDTSEGDMLDVRNVLSGYDPLTDAITDWVQITTSGSNSILSVDSDGGGNSFVQIATLTGVTGLTNEAALVTSGTLIVS